MLRRDFFKRIGSAIAAATLAAVPGARIVKGATKLRPYLDGKWITIKGYKVRNATTLLKKDWLTLDAAVIRVSRYQLARMNNIYARQIKNR